ncbi:MAG: EpsI family protein [Thermoguttaceae bacterium]|nr:EpsI family protein [Thermoguttaceae bacterium]
MFFHDRTVVRLAMVVGIIALVQLLTYQVRAMLKPAEVVLPDWNIEELPIDFAGWTGEVQELDERLFRRIGADAVADRVYENRQGDAVSAHTALFKDFDEAIVVHLPSRCYRAAGWEQRDVEKRTLTVDGLPDITVEVSTWQREGRRVKVLFWYQLGEHTVLGRYDLSRARMALAGHEIWPAMVKVMLETTADQQQAADLRLFDVAGQIRKWLYDRSGAPAPTGGSETDLPEGENVER